jgi:putative nucleotidyltransferase with HDIG domain
LIPSKKEAKEILNEYIKEKANLDHSYLVAISMEAIANYYKLNEEQKDYWYVVGLLHDLDLELINNNINKHTLITEKILKEKNIDQKLIDDIKSHNFVLNLGQSTILQRALFAIDPLTGILRAYTLMRPDKDIKQAKVKSIKKKIKDKGFARSVNRDQIKSCKTKLDIDLNKFIEIILNYIKEKDFSI